MRSHQHGRSRSNPAHTEKGTIVISDSDPTPEHAENISASVDEQAEPADAGNADNGVTLTTDEASQRDDGQLIKTDNA